MVAGAESLRVVGRISGAPKGLGELEGRDFLVSVDSPSFDLIKKATNRAIEQRTVTFKVVITCPHWRMRRITK